MMENKYNPKEKEEKWLKYWEENNIYKFNPSDENIFSIDTPPPTVSGNIHIGHIFSYSQTEMIARYKRLRGYNVFYPFGFDDNGLPTERLVEKENKLKAPDLSREEFNKLCIDTTHKYEENFKTLFSKMGVSTDWNIAYRTISNESIKISQLSFLDLAKKKKAYMSKSPALWCTECQTNIAQAELETKTLDTNFVDLIFKTEDDDAFIVATTRPELLPAIVAIFINPKDEKNKHLIGKTAITPLTLDKVKIMADDKVDMEKGSGIVMCCTFGDQTDIEWRFKYNLPIRDIITNYGRIKEDIPQYGNLKIKEARAKIIKDLDENNYLSKITPITHEVQTHERCGTEVEYTIMDQWFIDVMNHKEDFIKLGKEIKWHPEYMRSRYEEWINNLAWDWSISRNRYFGVPFPVWYCKSCGEIIYAEEKDLPVNPLSYKPKACPKCNKNELIPEKAVMDTWATSSVTPLINMKYKEENNLEHKLRPMSLRTNASDIIRTWDFYTIVKSFYHFNEKPWDNVMISGFVMADKGEKISKRKNNTKNDPFTLLDEYGADVIRYWAASGRLGTDITFSDETLKRGKKLINKIYNASKFVSLHLDDFEDKKIDNYEFFDKWILSKYNEMEKEYLNYLEKFEVGLALNTLEKFFWNFCDNYLEIVKHRLYRPDEFGYDKRYSGQKTVYTLLYKLIQNFSIFFPFVTEDIYQALFKEEKSVHITKINPLNLSFEDEHRLGDKLLDIISIARGHKTKNEVSLKTEITLISLNLSDELTNALKEAEMDFKACLFIKEIKINKHKDNFEVNDIKLGDN